MHFPLLIKINNYSIACKDGVEVEHYVWAFVSLWFTLTFLWFLDQHSTEYSLPWFLWWHDYFCFCFCAAPSEVLEEKRMVPWSNIPGWSRPSPWRRRETFLSERARVSQDSTFYQESRMAPSDTCCLLTQKEKWVTYFSSLSLFYEAKKSIYYMTHTALHAP